MTLVAEPSPIDHSIFVVPCAVVVVLVVRIISCPPNCSGRLKVYVINPEDAPKHTVLKIKDSDKGGPMGQRYCWYQCTVKGGREGKDIDAVSLAKVCMQPEAAAVDRRCVAPLLLRVLWEIAGKGEGVAPQKTAVLSC